MEKKNLNYLETEKIPTLMRKYALPCIISLLVGALYNIVDQIFIANAAYLGSYGNAANSVVYPLTVVALAIAVLVGDGACAFVSLCLGSKNNRDANKSVGNAITLSLLFGIILTLIYFLFQEPILTLFGGKVNDLTFQYSKEYFTFISLGVPFYMFGQAMNPIIRSDGSPNTAMAIALCGAAVNIVLDPICIYVLKWGMMGAAIATITGQILVAGLSVYQMMHLNTVTLSKKCFIPELRICIRTLTLGISSFLAQIALVVSIAAMQNMIVKYCAYDAVFSLAEYSQIPMAVVSIVMKVFQIVVSISIGLASGCIPIVSYNIGAGRKDRAKQLFKDLLLYEATVGLIATIIVEVFPNQLINIFGAQGESIYYTQFAIRAFRTYLCTMVLACVNKAICINLQAMGKALPSTLLSLLREFVFGVGYTLILPMFFGLYGLLYTMPAADISTFIISIFVVIYTIKYLNKPVEADDYTSLH